MDIVLAIMTIAFVVGLVEGIVWAFTNDSGKK